MTFEDYKAIENQNFGNTTSRDIYDSVVYVEEVSNHNPSEVKT